MDKDWRPLLNTPTHPEHPSGETRATAVCNSSAVAAEQQGVQRSVPRPSCAALGVDWLQGHLTMPPLQPFPHSFLQATPPPRVRLALCWPSSLAPTLPLRLAPSSPACLPAPTPASRR